MDVPGLSIAGLSVPGLSCVRIKLHELVGEQTMPHPEPIPLYRDGRHYDELIGSLARSVLR